MSKKLKDLNEHNAQASSMKWAMNDNSPVLNVLLALNVVRKCMIVAQ